MKKRTQNRSRGGSSQREGYTQQEVERENKRTSRLVEMVMKGEEKSGIRPRYMIKGRWIDCSFQEWCGSDKKKVEGN